MYPQFCTECGNTALRCRMIVFESAVLCSETCLVRVYMRFMEERNVALSSGSLAERNQVDHPPLQVQCEARESEDDLPRSVR